MAGHVWEWAKELFGKKAASCPWRIRLVIRKKTHKGDLLEVGFSSERQEKVTPQKEDSPFATLLNELPGAIGGECPVAPDSAADPNPEVPLLPREVPPSQSANATESSKTTTQSKGRRPKKRG